MSNKKVNELNKAIIKADNIIMKKYLNNLDEMPILKAEQSCENMKMGSNVGLFKIKSIVYDKNENTLDKLTTVYNSLSSYDDAVAVMLINGKKESVDIYIGAASKKHGDVEFNREIWIDTLQTAFVSNFPGSETDYVDAGNPSEEANQKEDEDEQKYKYETNYKVMSSVFEGKNAVSAVSGIPAIRNSKFEENKDFVQGIEKFINSMKGQEYAVIFIADVVNNSRISEMCSGYEDLYSQLYPFLKTEKTFNLSTQKGEIRALITGETNTESSGTSRADSISDTIGKFSSKSIGGGIGILDFHYTWGKSTAETTAKTESQMQNTAKSLTTQNSLSNSLTQSTGMGIQVSEFNRVVKTLLDNLDEQIKRLKNFENVGVFDCGIYFLADKPSITIAAATKYKALVRGENSFLEGSAINTWENHNPKHSGKAECKDAEAIFEWLKILRNPSIATNFEGPEDYDVMTPATLISGKELAIGMSLPKKSVSGITVLDCAEFGRDILYHSDECIGEIELGEIQHMHKPEGTKVKLNKNSLASHTFITGSTGSGKTTTVVKILSEAAKDDNTKFMVIEPAKGEYKNLIGADAEVYGINPYETKLLKINPFSFPQNVLVGEHIDGLIDIFNVCWPMYAAMPAILKDAVIRAYKCCGWNMKTSKNKYGRIFPTFKDVLNEIKKVLRESEYSSDNKGDYIGALTARINSLINGINGQIFSNDEIPDSDLFEKNVIIDLSKARSIETKSLFMGLLMMKLYEHRTATLPDNSNLRHITVLEEAHNLLKRTSTEYSNETSNLIGKSVEMIANSIAELRSYGEGFIIADQSPGLLDMSVIRNTNTKIIHRLPDLSDRELVGKAAALNDEQIVEVAKLKTGTAAIYQNNWINPVLCEVHKLDAKRPYEYGGIADEIVSDNETLIRAIFDIVILPHKKTKLNLDKIYKLSISGKTKAYLIDYLRNAKSNSDSKKIDAESKLVYSMALDCELVQDKKYTVAADIEKSISHEINNFDINYTEENMQRLTALAIRGYVTENELGNNMYTQYIDALKRR